MKTLNIMPSLSRNRIINFKATYMNINEKNVTDIIEDDSIYPMDPVSQNIRNRMRINMYNYAGIINCNPEYMSNQENIHDLHINNFQKLKKDSFRGALGYTNNVFFNFIEESGIQTIIDLAGISKVKDECKKRKINYILLDTAKNFWTNPIFKTDEEIYNMPFTNNEANNLLRKQTNKQREDFIRRFQKQMKRMSINIKHLISLCY